MRNFRLHLSKMCFVVALLCYSATSKVFAQSVTITVDANQNKKAVSPYIYGRNESFDRPVQFYKDAGLRFARVGGGNNMSAYNWRAKLTVHPDWFNNVYGTDWDDYAQKISDNFPGMQGMFAFQLLGRAASTGQYNFPDWDYMQSHPGWFGTRQNLAGGGEPNPDGESSQALVDGDINLFSKPWPADSSVAILDHWFGAGGKGFNQNQFQYWSMDNEADVWNGTHDWAMPTLISASAFVDRYIELAKKAKAKYPDIKLCGPVSTSEWQYYRWSNESIYIDGRYYPFMEYFIKRLGDEYHATGIKLLDVVDIHHYPWYNNDTEALQLHRFYYDTNYDYPGSNGIFTSEGGWNTSITKQYFFKRIDDWLNEHFGANHGIKAGLSEWSPGPNEPNLASVIYASHLGTFANNGVELFSPWNWFTGMWETLHLFSRYAKEYSVSSTSSLENTVSAYTTVNQAADSMTVIIVNRDMNAAQNVTVNLSGFSVTNGNYETLQLSSLPTSETFVSHTQNALKQNQVSVNSNSLTISVPALSTTAVLLTKSTGTPPPATTTYVTFANAATGLLIDGMGRQDDGSNAGQWSFSGADAQQWSIDTLGAYVMLKNKATGLYLDGMGRTANRSAVGQWSYSASDAQQWLIVTAGSHIKFKNRATGLYIDGLGETADGADLGQWKKSNHNNQKWLMSIVGNSARQSSLLDEAALRNPKPGETNFNVYPNPFVTSFKLEVTASNEPLQIAIFDVMGKEVETIRYSGESKVLSLGTNLNPGLYLVRVNGAGWSKSFKVLKED